MSDKAKESFLRARVQQSRPAPVAIKALKQNSETKQEKKLRLKSSQLIKQQAAQQQLFMEIFNWVGKNALLFKMVSSFVINDCVLVFWFHPSLPVEGINFTQLKAFRD